MREAGFLNARRARQARQGFSLVMVLIVAVIGMAISGVAFYLYESTSGQAVVTMERAEQYNVLQSAIEGAKSALVELTDNEDPVPRGAAVSDDRDIEAPDDLLVEELTVTEHPVDVGGREGALKVEVFDMVYDESRVKAMSAADLAKMPAAARLAYAGGLMDVDPFEGGQLGSYLIRATLTLDGEEKVMETALIQRNRAEVTVVAGGGNGDMTPDGSHGATGD